MAYMLPGILDWTVRWPESVQVPLSFLSLQQIVSLENSRKTIFVNDRVGCAKFKKANATSIGRLR